MKIFDNVTEIVRDDMESTIKRGSKVSIAAACFSMYAYSILKKELESVDEFRFIFTSPTFVTEKSEKQKREFYIPKLSREQSLYGTEFEIKLRNEMTQKAIAQECADWIRRKAHFKSNTTGENMGGFMTVASPVEDVAYMPLGGFTTVDIGCERGNNSYNMVNRMEAPFSTQYMQLFDSLWNDRDKLQDVTDVIVENISSAYNENAPEFIYFMMLYNVFSEFLEDLSEDVLPNEATDALLRTLDFDFFEVLDSVTIARSRRHIEKYYDTTEIGKFPTRLKPVSLRPSMTDLNSAINYNQIYEQLMLLTLCIYTPSNYIFPSKLSKYIDLTHNKGNNLTQRGREQGIQRLMSINLLKRLESSVYSFNLTLSRILDLIRGTIKAINDFEKYGAANLDMVEMSEGDFDMEDGKQTSFATAPLLTTEELSKEGMLESITFSATTFGKKDEQDPISAFLSDDVYMYANVKGSSIPQPIDEIPMDLHIGRDIDGAVCSGGQQYYSRYRLVRYSEGMDAVIGKSITLKISADKAAGKLNFKLAGTLNDYIRDTECMIAIIENRELSLNSAAFTFSDVGKANIEQYRQNLAYYQDVKKMLDVMGVTKELDPGNLSDQDEKNIRNFTNAIVHGHLIGFPGCSNDLVYGRFKIANLELCIWANKEDGGYRLQSFFSDHKIVLFASDDNENKNPYPVSHYVLLKKKDFLEIDNIDYEKIAADIAENSINPLVTSQLTLFMLEMLKAYDEQIIKDNRLLDLAEEYCSWLIALPDGNTEQLMLNRLQIKKRKGELTSEELSVLQEFRKGGHDITVRCGANLLLGKNESAQDCFDEMSPEEQKAFIEFPICKFGNLRFEREEV